MTLPHARTWLAYAGVALVLAVTVWAIRFPDEPPADFTFVNNTEVKSLDPAIVTGQPEGRILEGLFEGLINLDAKTLAVIPGIAEHWDLAEDKLRYTFHLRPNARWSDGSTITAHDVRWSLRRFLDPATAGQYAYQAWYIKNARRYTLMQLNEGDPLEVELNERPEGALPFARGKLLFGTLKKIEIIPAAGANAERKRFFVVIDGVERSFLPGSTSGDEACKQVLLDFREVGIRALGDHTLEVTLESPTPYFLSLLGFYPLFPVQPKCVETFGYPAWTKPENMVTGGPYTLQSRRIRDRLRMVRNEAYWDRENVNCRTIDALAVESVVTGLNLYLTGEADWITTIPSAIIPEILAEKRDDFHPVPELTVYFYRINCKRPALDNKLVRRALAMALNKQQVVDTVSRAGELPARSFVPPGLPGYHSPLGPDYDPEGARRLLSEAGYPEGRGMPSIPILYNTDEAHQSIAELIQDQWKRTLAIDVSPQNQPWPTYLASQRTLDYWVCRAGWGGDYLDPNTFLDLFVTDGANNETGWSNAEYDRLIKAAATEFDAAERMKLFEKAEVILLDEMPIIPIYFRVSKNMVRPYVKGFYNNPLDMHPLKAIEIDEAEKSRILGGGRP